MFLAFHMIEQHVDIKENDIFALSPELLKALFKDQTLSTEDKQINIFWATDSYAERGVGYQYGDQITIDSITGDNGNVIVPRAVKSRQQQQRSREMAEVFTPSWICNKQNNLGKFMEWVSFTILTWSWAGAVFALWTFANLALPRPQNKCPL